MSLSVFYRIKLPFNTFGPPQAGIVIAQEAGGFVTGSKNAPHDGIVTEAILTGRRYLVIRGVAGTAVSSALLSQVKPKDSDGRDLTSNLHIHSYIYSCVHPSIRSFIQEESGLDVQKRIAREFYDTVEDIPLDDD
jgi:myo-inositol-1(or 4)-monophosphatase